MHAGFIVPDHPSHHAPNPWTAIRSGKGRDARAPDPGICRNNRPTHLHRGPIPSLETNPCMTDTKSHRKTQGAQLFLRTALRTLRDERSRQGHRRMPGGLDGTHHGAGRARHKAPGRHPGSGWFFQRTQIRRHPWPCATPSRDPAPRRSHPFRVRRQASRDGHGRFAAGCASPDLPAHFACGRQDFMDQDSIDRGRRSGHRGGLMPPCYPCPAPRPGFSAHTL